MPVASISQRTRFLLLILSVLVFWHIGNYFHLDFQGIQKTLQGFPFVFSAALYVLLYVVFTFFVFFAKDMFWLVGALVFGAFYSAAFILVAEAINAWVLFHFARSLGRGYVARSLSPAFRHLDESLGSMNFFWLFIFRAAPLIPYRFLDLAAGVTALRFPKYLAAVIFGSALKIFWIQYLLSALGQSAFDPYALSLYFRENKSLLLFSLIYGVFVLAVAHKMKGKR
jgi:uncharacterized membrane protein YdjX (TVP38/TMEM64 family)